ncbi:sporulation protein [Lentzea sp. NPDC005914]|uniref:sporulation protein n=1 Tax=Lentzea sp. NPDC005914 TaxID=3154572 RepID=UPI0033DE2537
MFSRMLNALGVGGPSADTVLDSPRTVPGQVITGQAHLQGGRSEAVISQVVLSLVTSVEAEHGDRELHRVVARRAIRVLPGEVVSIPFQLAVPWETPITAVGGLWLPGVSVGVRTEVFVAGVSVHDDLDVVQVEPAPGQRKVLEAFGQLGFRLRGSGVDAGRLPGVRHEPGYYQEIELVAPARYADRIGEVELTFVAGEHELHVILEADGRGGGPLGLFHATHQAVLTLDWPALIGAWLEEVASEG